MGSGVVRAGVQHERREATSAFGVSLRAVSHWYGEVRALAEVDLDVAQGDLVALIGRNGAGKTTLSSIVAGLERPTSGLACIGGRTVAVESARTVGYAPQQLGLYPGLTVRQNLEFFAHLHGLRRRQRRAAVAEVVERLQIERVVDAHAGTLSGGQKRRVHLATALVHRPSVLVLDEVTAGVDPPTRAVVLDSVLSAARAGAAVLYTTHYLEEVEQLDARVVVLHEGKVTAKGAVDDLVREFGQTELRVAFRSIVPPRLPGARHDNELRIVTNEPEIALAKLLSSLGRHTSSLERCEIVRPTLTSVFARLTSGPTLEDGVRDVG
jgi:ABC-2 type transport system ATP-binding protein